MVKDTTRFGYIVSSGPHKFTYNRKPFRVTGDLKKAVHDTLKRAGHLPAWLYMDNVKTITIGPDRPGLKLCGCCDALTCKTHLAERVTQSLDTVQKDYIRNAVKEIQRTFDSHLAFLSDRKAKELFKKWQDIELKETRNLTKKVGELLYDPDDLV